MQSLTKIIKFIQFTVVIVNNKWFKNFLMAKNIPNMIYYWLLKALPGQIIQKPDIINFRYEKEIYFKFKLNQKAHNLDKNLCS